MTILDDARPGMHPDIRPQDDLFGHVNGRWLDTVEIPEDRSSWGPFVMLADEAEARVRRIIEDCAEVAAQGRADDAADRAIGDLFASFVDEARAEELGHAPIQDALRAVAQVADLTQLARELGRLERTGGSGLFGSYVDTDDRKSDRYLLNVRQGGLGLPDESYYRDEKFAEIRTAYVAHLTRMARLVGHEAPERAAEQVMDVETRLARGHWERAATRDVLKTYNLTTVDELRGAAPAFDWDAWAEGLGASPQVIAETIVRQPSYLEHLSATLQEVPLEAWREWLAARVIRAAAPYLSSAFVEESFDFYGRTLNGTPELRARWKRGVSLVEGALGEAVGEKYVARHFPPSSKVLMDDLVENLLDAYRRHIEALEWMGEDTKRRAFDKLATFNPKIGYPRTFRDYSALTIVPDDLLANVRTAAAFETDRQLGKIGSPVDRDEWFMLPQTVNAYYNPGTNEICFPAGILQRPFFDPEADPAENYGGIGAVIGHEIGHGFDDQGSQYDGAGNLNEWWTTEDRARFTERADKLIKQYDAFAPRNLPEEKVNGSLTVGENIGDLGGLTIALSAYEATHRADAPAGLEVDPGPDADAGGSSDALPTGTQRLFLNWACVWRTKRRIEQERQFLTIDPHSPPEFRANIVRNLDEFHAAFDTSPEDALWLEPDDRVRIW